MPSLTDYYGRTGPAEDDRTPGEAVVASGNFPDTGHGSAWTWITIVGLLIAIRLLYEWSD